MLYKPNYCCHCGETIERIEWRFWTSRRFCESCEQVFRREEWLPRLGAGVAILCGLLGFGSYLKTPEKPLHLSTNQLPQNSANRMQNQAPPEVGAKTNQSSAAADAHRQNMANNTNAASLPAQKKKGAEFEAQQNTKEEPVYFCGAQTKKGSPCTRKVKGGGRCWQHEGQPAMLPKEKLNAGH